MKFQTKHPTKTDQKNKYLVFLPIIKEEKTQKFTTTIFTILALIFFAIFAINPTLSTIASLQKQLEDNKLINRKLEEKINNLSSLQSQYSNLKNDLPFIYSAIPQSSDIPKLAGQIENIARQSNLIVSSFQSFPVDVSDDLILDKKYSAFSFNMTANGSYLDIKNFILRVNNMERIILIDNTTISKTGLDNSTALQMNLKGFAYFKK